MSRFALPARMSAASAASPDYGLSDEPNWREVPWCRLLRDVDVRGTRVRYLETGSGDGPPLLLVHGVAGCWQHWLENIAPLARERRVIAVDLPGFGHSEPLPEPPTMMSLAEHLDAFCDALDTGPVVAGGNSMGGFIAAEMALRHPERVERLVLVDAAGLSITRGRQWHLLAMVRLLSAFGTTSPLAERRSLRRPLARHLALGGMVRHPTRLRMDLICEQLDGTGTPAFRESFTAMRSYDFSPLLPEVSCPTLVVFGRDDVLVPVCDAHELGRLIPHSQVLIMDDTGHMPMLERPRRFNAAVRAFLADEPLPAG